MITHDTKHKDGSRAIQISTACGYQITLIKNPEDYLKLICYFDGHPASICNGMNGFSRDGALSFANALQEIYNES